MFEQKYDSVTFCMLLGLAIGLMVYLVTGQRIYIALGLAAGNLLGVILDQFFGRVAVVEDWPELARES